MKQIILQQLQERNDLLGRPYIDRDIHLDRKVWLQNPMIKLITGPRRVGKSTFALLLLRQENFAYLNFDDALLLQKWDEETVMHVLDEVYPGYDYLMLDEVQNLPHWDLWVSKLYRRGKNLVITGSNANMLSSEMATVLTGRYMPIPMLPFSLTEWMTWNCQRKSEGTALSEAQVRLLEDDYLHNGGYPETLEARSITANYLGTLYEAMIWKDVAQRHKVRNITDLSNLANYLLSNFCNPFTANELAESLHMSSVTTVRKFMGYLHEPFLFYYLPRYNNKLKLMKRAAQKVYVVDNGFVQAKGFNLSEGLGRLLENQVFVELIRQGYDTECTLFYYRSRNDKETDFVTRQGTRIEQLIQVCYDLSNTKTLKREVDSLLECAQELHCENLLIVTDHESRTLEQGGHVIRIVTFSEFSHPNQLT